jgi:fumarate reductase iron-sulfur subunit
MAICGSCGMMINGEAKLACHAFLRDYRRVAIRIEPLDHFPIERDLVIVMDSFMEKLSSVKPYLMPKEEKPVREGEYLQTPLQLMAFKQYTLCINCMLCYAACPQTALNVGFIGPAALALAHRYNLDSRDNGKEQRADIVASDEGIWECTFVGACSEVCPKHVDPAAAIQQTKISASLDWFKARLMPGASR